MVMTLPALIGRARDGMTFPVLMKEMRTQMRGMRAPTILLITTGIAIAVCLCILLTQYGRFDGTPEHWIANAGDVGRALFIGLIIVQGALVVLIAPALTAGAIAGEREQQTLEFLLLTRLSGANIVMGKLLSSLSFLFMTMLCALPVTAIAFFFGGVAPGQLLWIELLMLAATFGFGAISLACSARLPRAGSATALAYSLCIGWLVLMPLVRWLLDMFRGNVYEANVFVSLGLSVVLLLFMATLPTAAVTGVFFLLKHRRLGRLGAMITWGIFAMGASLLLYLPGADTICDGDFFLFANPVVAVYTVINTNPYLGDYNQAYRAYAASPYQDAPPVSPWLLGLSNSEWFSIITAIALLLAITCLALLFTTRELQRLRR